MILADDSDTDMLLLVYVKVEYVISIQLVAPSCTDNKLQCETVTRSK